MSYQLSVDVNIVFFGLQAQRWNIDRDVYDAEE